jgi:hypothetical protein
MLIVTISFNSLAQKPFALVELFTSEGCSSCPPADELLSSVKNDAVKSGQNIITLSYHVDYWNKGGWKDPFSKNQFTLRQENYSRIMPDKEMYTPEAIVNGQYSFTGSNKVKMKENIEKALNNKPENTLLITIDSTSNDSVFISYEYPVHSKDLSLRFALTEDGLSNNIKAGENSGKTLNHDSVVRNFTTIDSPPTKGNIKMPWKVFTGNGSKHLVAFVQKKITMNVLAATSVDIK